MQPRVFFRPVKAFAKRVLRNCPLTEGIIAAEPDDMPVEEFILKAKIWLQVLAKELQTKESH